VNGRDPFGLKVCFEADTHKERQELADEFAEATQTTKRMLDKEGCIRTATPLPGSGKAARVYRAIAESDMTAFFGYGSLGTSPGSGHDPSNPGHTLIDPLDVGQLYGVTPTGIPGVCNPARGATYALHQIIVHEVGHVATGVLGFNLSGFLEREYQQRKGMPQRPDKCAHFAR
jgi:hypothetical protein